MTNTHTTEAAAAVDTTHTVSWGDYIAPWPTLDAAIADARIEAAAGLARLVSVTHGYRTPREGGHLVAMVGEYQVIWSLSYSEAVALVTADLNAYADEAFTHVEAVAHVRNTLRLPDDEPVPGSYPITEDGSQLAAAYRVILEAHA